MDPLVDLSDVKRLIEIVERHGLESLTVQDDEVEVSITAEPTGEVQATAGGAAMPVAEADAGGALKASVEPSRLYQLKSPITGVFYRSPAPTQPPFCQVGDLVDEHDPVCLIEAMKIFNEITAGVRGKLARVVAANEQLVVTGEVLMEFERLEGGES